MDASHNTKYGIRDDVSTEGNGNTDLMELRAKKDFVIPLGYTYEKDDSYTDISKARVSETLPERASLPAGKADSKAADSRCSRKKYILVGIVAVLGLGVLVGTVVAGVLLTETEEHKEVAFNEICSKANGDMCVTPYAICISQVCVCSLNRYHDSTTDSCIPGGTTTITTPTITIPSTTMQNRKAIATSTTTTTKLTPISITKSTSTTKPNTTPTTSSTTTPTSPPITTSKSTTTPTTTEATTSITTPTSTSTTAPTTTVYSSTTATGYSGTPTTDSSTSGTWMIWGSWTACDVTCGEGVHTRYRICNNTIDSPCQGNSVEQELCQMSECPVFGKWTTWAAWGNCDVTCGVGTHTRTRICTKVGTLDKDCAGDSSMEQTCNQWECPDCSKTCITGTLNADCDACICDTTVILNVKSSKGIPIQGASVYASLAKTTLLSTTNDTGVATLQSTCINSEVLVTLESYQEQLVLVQSESINVILTFLEYPHFEQEPRSKPRLVGESVTFCCIAVGDPSIKYYEWFFDNNQLPRTLYPNGTHLTLNDVQLSDSGLYKCRANSDVGAAFSALAKLTVKENESAFCEDSLIDKLISLPSDCIQESTNSTTYKVGACRPKTCRQTNSIEDGSCDNTNYSVCQASHTEKVTLQCIDYELEYIVITACDCGDYVKPSVAISGLAIGLNTGIPLKYGTVLVDGVSQAYTSESGYFSLSVSLAKRTVTITFIDEYFNEFLPMIRQLTLSSDSTDDVFLTINMIHVADPIEIDSQTENKIYTGSNASDSNNVAEIIVPADSFYKLDGTKYTGNVLARLTFIDPTNQNISNSFPGVFRYINEEGEAEPLQTLGVFSLKFYDGDSNELFVSQSLTLSLNEDIIGSDTSDYALWRINTATGVWEVIGNGIQTTGRRKRDFRYLLVSQCDPWCNIDKIADVRKTCFFRPLIYGTSELRPATEVEMNLDLTYYIRIGKSLEYGYSQIKIPSTLCFELACDEQEGVLDIYTDAAKEDSNIRPVYPEDESSYTVSNNGRLVEITLLVDDDNGPLYSTKAQCKVKPQTILKYYLPSSVKEVYTYKKVTESTKYFPSPMPSPKVRVGYVEADKKVWFKNHGHSATRSCHLKVSIVNAFPNRTTKIRAVSKENIVGDVLGIREVEYDATVNGTCVEYRCSNTNTNTFVIVSLLYEVQEGEDVCTITGESSDIVNANGGVSYVDDEVFSVYIPLVPTTSGTYQHDTTSYKGDEKAKISKVDEAIRGSVDECNNGDSVAVTFSCPERRVWDGWEEVWSWVGLID